MKDVETSVQYKWDRLGFRLIPYFFLKCYPTKLGLGILVLRINSVISRLGFPSSVKFTQFISLKRQLANQFNVGSGTDLATQKIDGSLFELSSFINFFQAIQIIEFVSCLQISYNFLFLFKAKRSDMSTVMLILLTLSDKNLKLKC